MYQLEHFAVADLVECSNDLRSLGEGAQDMEEVAQQTVRRLYGSLVTSDQTPACALVRFYKTHPLKDLSADLQQFARRLHPGPLDDDVRCLTLLATAGREPAWNDRRKSVEHQAIPLAGTTFFEQSPMIASLVADFGIDADFVVRPNPADIIDRHHRTYGVFHVARARGSQAVPAQGFVENYGIESVVGLGGVLPSGDLFAVVMFTTVPVSAEVAELLRSLGMAVKAAIVRHTFKVFSSND